MSNPTDAVAALSRFLAVSAALPQIEPLGAHGGWSGSRLWRITLPNQRQFCLRQWPEGHPSPDRLRFIHQVLDRVVAGGLAIVPAPLKDRHGNTLVSYAGRLWELTPWLPGEADFHSHPSPRRLQSALEALARFHNLAESDPPRRERAPSLCDRHEQITLLLNGELAEIGSAVSCGLQHKLDIRARQMLDLAPSRLTNLQHPLRAAAEKSLPLSPAIRDIHHDHVLFLSNDVSGIVDFGALRVDTPLTDIARLVGSLVGDDAEQRALALDAYSRLRPLSQDDRLLIDLLDKSNLVLGGLNWLKWLYVEHRDMGDFGPILRRLDEILTRL